jgi:Arc/MetJ-type ribon-helix-helix transcriptional regulator
VPMPGMMIGHTVEDPAMPAAKIAITIDEELLWALDLWVTEGKFPNRSKAIQAAVKEKYDRWKKTRLADACAKADPKEEQAEADIIYKGEIFPWGEE